MLWSVGLFACWHSTNVFLLDQFSLLPSSAVAPVFVEVFNATEVTYNGTLTLTCSATATPRPEFSWMYEGDVLANGTNDVMILDSASGERVLESMLVISSPFIDRNGSYSCVATNVVDMATSTNEVTIFCELGVCEGIWTLESVTVYITLHHTKSHYITLHHITSHYITPCHNAAHYITLCVMVWGRKLGGSKSTAGLHSRCSPATLM